MNIEILKTIILSCQVIGASNTNYEYALARQRMCQRELVKCVADMARDHRDPSQLSDWDLSLCIGEMLPEKTKKK